jgi:arylsulfatase A
MIIKWPKQIVPNSTTNHNSAFWDVLPTIADVLNDEKELITNGISFLPTLESKPNNQKQHDYLYWEFHENNSKQAIIKDNWKFIITKLNTEPRYFLFNLENDISEERNLISTYPEKAAELQELMKKSRTPSTVFNFKKNTN